LLNRAFAQLHAAWSDRVAKSISNAGFGFSAAALAASSAVELTEQAQAAVRSILARVPEVVKHAENLGGDMLEFVDESSSAHDTIANLRVTAVILGGIAQLADALETRPELSVEDAAMFASYVLQFQRPGSAEEAFLFSCDTPTLSSLPLACSRFLGLQFCAGCLHGQVCAETAVGAA